MSTNWMNALSDTVVRLEERVRHLEVRVALLSRSAREDRAARKAKPGVDWNSPPHSWLLRLLLLFGLLAFNWTLPDAMALLAQLSAK